MYRYFNNIFTLEFSNFLFKNDMVNKKSEAQILYVTVCVLSSKLSFILIFNGERGKHSSLI